MYATKYAPLKKTGSIKTNSSKGNMTGIPTSMKNYYETASGLSFDDVRIHYNSGRPAQLWALAYTQGNHVYIGPGQEQHLPHELGHVIQQKTGRVPVTGYINGLPLNDSPALEQQADAISSMTTAIPSTNQSDAPVEVVQRYDFFSELIKEQSDPLEWVKTLLAALVPEVNDDIINQPMNFNALNRANKLAGKSPNIYGYSLAEDEHEATIYEYIKQQLEIIPSMELTDPPPISTIQMGVVLNGISRMLARKLGDLGASDQILKQLLDNIGQLLEPDEQRHSQMDQIAALARNNPILMYLHDEINAHDAAVMLHEQNKALGGDKEKTFKLLEQQALMQILAMRQLNSSKSHVAAARTKKLSIDDAVGLYSAKFLCESIVKDGDTEKYKWTDKYNKSKDKLYEIFNLMPPDTQAGKYIGTNPTLAKARKHEAHSFILEGTSIIKNDLQTTAINNALRLYNMIFSGSEPVTSSEVLGWLTNIISRLSQAPIMITRFASSLLSKELSSNRGDQVGRLTAGTPLSQITLDRLIAANQDIRYDPGQQSLPAHTESGTGKISYTALLSANSSEGSERGISYPIFRSNKNRLYAGKTKQAPEAIFGTLCLNGAQDYHGLGESGKQSGTYGDVVIIFRQGAFKELMYTAGDRMRGYTDLRAFVFNLFASLTLTEEGKKHYLSEVLIPGNDENYNPVCKLAKNLLFLVLDQPAGNLETLEVQIFEPVELSKKTVSHVYFAGSVKPDQQYIIMNAIFNAPVPVSSSPDLNTNFYVYNPFYSERYHPTQWLYSKSRDTDRRRMTVDDVSQVLVNPLNFFYWIQFRNKYGFHSEHTGNGWTPEEKAAFEKIHEWFEGAHQYIRSRNISPNALNAIACNERIFESQ